MKHYDFAERLAYSEGIECPGALRRRLIDSIPGAYEIQKATKNQDRNGTDFWIHRYELEPLSVDFKHRSFCPIQRWDSDDACIEWCSVYKAEKGEQRPRPPYEPRRQIRPGWSIDANKHTDLVIYTWPAALGKRRFWILFFPHLCEASRRNLEAWRTLYREEPTPNSGYWTLNVYVPRIVIAKAMRELTTGVV